MSTVPGDDSWRDAGLAPVNPDEPRRLADDVDPADPADPADAAEQDTEVLLGDEVDED